MSAFSSFFSAARSHSSSSSSSSRSASPPHPFQLPEEGLQISSFELAGNSSSSSDENVPLAPPTATPFDPDEIDWTTIDDPAEKEEEEEEEDDQDGDGKDEVGHKRRKTNHHDCPACEFAPSEQELEGNPLANDFIHHYHENMLEASRAKVAKQSQDIYNQNNRPFLPGKPKITARRIAEHCEEHAVTPVTCYYKDLRTYNHALRIIRKRKIFLKDDQGNEEVDHKELKQYMGIAAARNAAIKSIQTASSWPARPNRVPVKK
jgi:hypothetical protein